MTDPGFKVKSIHQGVPFRARAAFRGYQAFRDESGAVLVEPGTAQGLRGAAERAYPMETGGLLSGRVLRDNDGQYVLISGFVQADHGAGRSAAFEISPQATALLREEAHRAHPTADVVGWWHSHPRPSFYSQTDLNTQAVFTQKESVGLLVFAKDEPWARAYMGPEARRLGLPAKVRTAEPRDTDSNGQPAADPRPDQTILNMPDLPPPRVDGRPSTVRSQGLVRLAVITAGVLLLLVILAITMVITVLGLPSQITSAQQQVSNSVISGERQLADQVSAAQQQLSGELKGTQAGLAPVSVSYSCLPSLASNGHYRGSFDCRATTSVPTGQVKWYLDGTYKASGDAVTVLVPLSGGTHHQIQAILETSTGRYPAPAQRLF